MSTVRYIVRVQTSYGGVVTRVTLPTLAQARKRRATWRRRWPTMRVLILAVFTKVVEG